MVAETEDSKAQMDARTTPSSHRRIEPVNKSLVARPFAVTTRIRDYPAKLITPLWAQGFECEGGTCGLCCITETQGHMQQIRNACLNRELSAHYNETKRVCRQYEIRPFMCEFYPFFLGVEAGHICVTTSLECPGTNSTRNTVTDPLPRMFEDPNAQLMTDGYSILYEHTVDGLDVSLSAWETMKRRVQDFFRRKFSFPFQADIRLLTHGTIFEALGLPTPEFPPVPVADLIRACEGHYIATRFENHHLAYIGTEGSQTVMALFDRNLKETKKTKITTPTRFRELEMGQEAKQLLKDYISLLCNRPFLSLASIISQGRLEQVMSNLAMAFCGAIGGIEVGATLISIRDNLNEIDRETMRETISFSEPKLRNLFIDVQSLQKI